MNIDEQIIELRAKVIYSYYKLKKYDVIYTSVLHLVRRHNDSVVKKMVESMERKKLRFYARKFFKLFSSKMP